MKALYIKNTSETSVVKLKYFISCCRQCIVNIIEPDVGWHKLYNMQSLT